MASLPQPIVDLTAALGRLPGIGPRSAERISLHLVQADAGSVERLAEAILHARKSIAPCQFCGSLTEKQPCRICQDGTRDQTVVCLVERAVDVVTIEKPGSYKGLYHVLGGRLSPTNGVGPEDLRVQELEDRIREGVVRELILALRSDVEGDATCYFLKEQFAALPIRISQLAHGLPVGGNLEFADELTLSRAIQGRRELE